MTVERNVRAGDRGPETMLNNGHPPNDSGRQSLLALPLIKPDAGYERTTGIPYPVILAFARPIRRIRRHQRLFHCYSMDHRWPAVNADRGQSLVSSLLTGQSCCRGHRSFRSSVDPSQLQPPGVSLATLHLPNTSTNGQNQRLRQMRGSLRAPSTSKVGGSSAVKPIATSLSLVLKSGYGAVLYTIMRGFWG